MPHIVMDASEPDSDMGNRVLDTGKLPTAKEVNKLNILASRGVWAQLGCGRAIVSVVSILFFDRFSFLNWFLFSNLWFQWKIFS